MQYFIERVRDLPKLLNSHHLRESEQVKLAVICRFPRGGEAALAIVSHLGSDHEEASLFVFKLNNLNPPVLRLVEIAPLTPDLTTTLAQTTSGNSAEDSLGLSRTEFLLTVSPPNHKDIILRTVHSLDIHDILSEIKRLQHIHGVSPNRLCTLAPHPSLVGERVAQHSWISHYVSIIDLIAPHRPKWDYQNHLRPEFPPTHLSDASAGMNGDEESDINLLRDAWIRHQLRIREAEFSTKHNISIRIGTFNVQSKPRKDRLSTGCQMGELDTSAEGLLYSSTTVKEDLWYQAILRDMGEVSRSYHKLVSKQLVGMLIIVLVRKELRAHISSISTASAGVGFLNTLGNKGGVALRIQIRDTTLCLVNSHLAAYDEMAEKRNLDYRELCRRLSFPLLAATPAEAANSPPGTAPIFDCDCLFWMGGMFMDAEVRALLNESGNLRYDALLTYDQLLWQQSEGNCFSGFVESRITFPPTYKYATGPAETLYDVRRRPAWTDRILHWSPLECAIPQSYSSHPIISISDHKPVSARFTVQLRSIKWDQFRTVFEELLDLISASEIEDVTPRIDIDRVEIYLGALSYDTPKSVDIQLKNTGEVAAAFRFIAHQPGGTIGQCRIFHLIVGTYLFPAAPSWLSITPNSGFLLPGSALTIKMTACIDRTSAPLFNVPAKSPNILETMILHVEKGKDHFFVIDGSFVRTCFATDLATLSMLPTVVRDFKGVVPSTSQQEGLSAPREFLRMIQWLMTNALNVENLFTARGNKKISRTIREALDTGEDLPTLDQPVLGVEGKSVHTISWSETCLSVADTLLEFLGSLTEPVVPFVLQENCARVTNRAEAFEFLRSLQPISANVIISLTAFLHFFLQAQRSEATNPNHIASVFSSLILPDPEPPAPRLSPLTKRGFFLHFL
ncbi:hypothetical protein BS47DRAFT_1398971 [Hydnum rufescens UP504]|uniref:Rho-GAP domain-containing protein n=1 Tax=Hydnum rufescens UP504 TaxID=1448309 RepID=A0A9P6DQX3_9AGAM|nr:hypothetical protein BS47DRAFT_1398971 [Hydnum rufescens UP504]